MSKGKKGAKREKESVAASVRASFKGKSFRVGGYSVVAMALALAIVVAVNLFVSAIPSVYTKVDLTDNDLFTLSEQTTKLLTGLKKDVEITWVVQSGYEDTMVDALLDRYTSLSSRLTSKKVDPVTNPTLLRESTVSNIGNNSLIVACGEVTRHIAYGEIVVSDYANYYVDGSVTQSFDGESALTSAIDYVTSDSLPVLYTLTGHGESSLNTSVQTAIEKENMSVQSLNLLTQEAVPSDADCVVIVSPQHDISADEKERLLAYLRQGGTMLLLTDYTGEAMPYLASLMDEYDVTAADGIVVEGNANHMLWDMPYYLLPDIKAHAITGPLIDGGYYALLPVAQGLFTDSNLRDTLSITTLLQTSDAAFSKTAGYDMTTYEREAGDIDGPFALGVAIEEETSGGNTQIVWLTSSQMLESDVDKTVSGANMDLVMNALGWMVERENSISIRAKSLMVEALVVPSGDASRWSIAMIGVIPLAVLASGIFVIIKRRRA